MSFVLLGQRKSCQEKRRKIQCLTTCWLKTLYTSSSSKFMLGSSINVFVCTMLPVYWYIKFTTSCSTCNCQLKLYEYSKE